MYTETMTQRLGLTNGVLPQTLNNGRLNSDYVDMSKFKRALFILAIGASNTGNVSAWLQEDSVTNFSNSSNDTAGSFNSASSGTSQTGLTASSKEYTFEVRADQLTAGKRYVRLQIKETNVGTATVAVADPSVPTTIELNN